MNHIKQIVSSMSIEDQSEYKALKKEKAKYVRLGNSYTTGYNFSWPYWISRNVHELNFRIESLLKRYEGEEKNKLEIFVK